MHTAKFKLPQNPKGPNGRHHKLSPNLTNGVKGTICLNPGVDTNHY